MSRARLFAAAAAAFAMLVLLALPHVANAQTSPARHQSAWRYDAAGRVTGTISPPPGATGTAGPYLATRTTYDSAGRPALVEEGWLAVWKAETIAPSSWGTDFTVSRKVATTYDRLDRKLTEKAIGADNVAVSLTQHSYDAFGHLECTAVRMNPAIYANLPASACTLGTEGTQGPDRITRKVYDAGGQLLQVREGVGTAVESAEATYSYTVNGKMAQVIDANGNRAQLAYDGFDRQVAWIFPVKAAPPAGYNDSTPANALATSGSAASCNLGTIAEVNGITGPAVARNATDDCEKYAYDRTGNRARLVKRDGSVLDYAFDNLNRMTVKTVPERVGLGPTHTRDVFYKYDLRGLMTEARFDSTSGPGIITAYDGFGRIKNATQTIDGTTRVLSYCYDKHGNRTRLGYPDASTSSGDCAATWTNFVSYSYDGLDRPTSIGGNGLVELKKYVYDPDGSLKEDWTGNMAWGSTLYTRDPAGRLSSMYRNLYGSTVDYTTTYGYNPASQVVQESRDNDLYAWTAHANVDRNYTTNGLNQYTVAGPASFCYDLNGNLTADGSSVFLYDVENRLVERRSQGAGNTDCAALSYGGALLAQLRYDPMGRLYEVVGSVGGATRFLYDGDALVGEYDATVTAGTGNLLHRYAHGADGKADDPIALYVGAAMNNASLWFFHADRQGSINAVANTLGNPARLFKYDEYGIPQSGDGAALTPANGARFLYTGQAWIADLGMYYYKARIYSPTLGRFLQTDPIGYEDQVNLYAYVANDPINMVDFDGKYGRGAGFSDKEWKKFDKMQQKAAASMEKRAGKLEAKAAKLDAKGKEGGDSMRQQATSLRGGAAALRSDGSDGKMANVLSQSDFMAKGFSNDAVAAAQVGGTTMWLNRGRSEVWSGSSMMAKWVVGHESLHTAGLRDQRGLNGQTAYRWGLDPQKEAYEKMKGTSQALINPDHLMDEVF